MRKILAFLMICVLWMSSAGQVMTPDDMRYLDSSGKQFMVSDPAGYLSPQVKADVESQLENLRKKYSVEIALVIPPEIGDMEPNQWCEQLFTKWKIGKADKDNGLLIMISPGSRCAFIMPGYGMEGVFTDIACARIVRDAIVPAMKEDNINEAVENTVSIITEALSDPAVAEELRSDRKENMLGDFEALDSTVLWTFVQYVVVFIFLVSLFLFLYYCVKARRFQTHYEKAEFWRGHLKSLFILGLFSFGTGLVFFALAFIIYRSWRIRPLSCSTCGHKMKRLSEEDDNELLSDSQDFEEHLKTVDYDVWECPQCGTIERFPFKSSQKKYSECPRCHTVAMCLESDSVVRPSTTRAVGEGVKVYGCKYCHKQIKKPYVIPKKEDPSAALAAGAVLGAAAGSRRGGGNGFGGGGFGGFGGGATGGGGAGGRW